ncbi:helix-turn-helix domain-containing protein [Solidesulfovibrio fructosivorans]|uniref:helix-turn-helix domain-containing protein n=1 Tax=Solidesulfovibrio fructosivorans TaxID=878 RepID=UPI00117FE9E3
MKIEGGAPKRFWARHKTQALLRLLRGENIDLVSQKLVVTAATLSQWRDTFLGAGESGLKSHPVKESRRRSARKPWKMSCFERKTPDWSKTALWHTGVPSRLCLHRECLRPALVCRIWNVSKLAKPDEA